MIPFKRWQWINLLDGIEQGGSVFVPTTHHLVTTIRCYVSAIKPVLGKDFTCRSRIEDGVNGVRIYRI